MTNLSQLRIEDDWDVRADENSIPPSSGVENAVA